MSSVPGYTISEWIHLNYTQSEEIPKKIHFSWKTDNLTTFPIKNSIEKWKSLYPDYTVKLWTDNF